MRVGHNALDLLGYGAALVQLAQHYPSMAWQQIGQHSADLVGFHLTDMDQGMNMDEPHRAATLSFGEADVAQHSLCFGGEADKVVITEQCGIM